MLCVNTPKQNAFEFEMPRWQSHSVPRQAPSSKMTSHLRSPNTPAVTMPHAPLVSRVRFSPVVVRAAAARLNGSVFTHKVAAVSEAVANAEGALARKFAVWLENRVKVRARAQSYWRVFGQAHACGVLVWCHRAPRVPSVVRCAMHHRRGVTRPSLSVAAGVLAPDASTRDKPRAARLRKE